MWRVMQGEDGSSFAEMLDSHDCAARLGTVSALQFHDLVQVVSGVELNFP